MARTHGLPFHNDTVGPPVRSPRHQLPPPTPKQSPRRLLPLHQPPALSSDISYLADSQQHRPRGGLPPRREPDYGAQVADWHKFKRSVASRRRVQVQAAPPPLLPPASRATASDGRPTSMWASRGFTQSAVSGILFPEEAHELQAVLQAAAALPIPAANEVDESGTPGSPRLAARRAPPVQPVPSSVELLGTPREPPGRAQVFLSKPPTISYAKTNHQP